MSKENSLNKTEDNSNSTKQFIGLIIVTAIVISFFAVLNGIFGGGDELVEKMKLEEQRIAEERKLSELISCLLYTSPSPRDYAASRMPSSA